MRAAGQHARHAAQPRPVAAAAGLPSRAVCGGQPRGGAGEGSRGYGKLSEAEDCKMIEGVGGCGSSGRHPVLAKGWGHQAERLQQGSTRACLCPPPTGGARRLHPVWRRQPHVCGHAVCGADGPAHPDPAVPTGGWNFKRWEEMRAEERCRTARSLAARAAQHAQLCSSAASSGTSPVSGCDGCPSTPVPSSRSGWCRARCH